MPLEYSEGMIADLDLAVEGLQPEDFVLALNACHELLPPGMVLDLVPLESAWPELLALIEGEVEMPKDPRISVSVTSFVIRTATIWNGDGFGS